MTFAWRPGSQYDVTATRRADSVLASDCRAQFWSSFNKARMSHLCDSTVAGPTARRDNHCQCTGKQMRIPPFPLPPPFKCALKNRDRKNHDSQRRDRILCFFLRPEIGQVSPHFGGDFLTELHSEPGEKGEETLWRKLNKSQWRRHPEITDFCPLSWSNAS